MVSILRACFYDARIDVKAGYIRPVLIEIRTGSRSHNRARDIRASLGKCLDAAIAHAAIKPGITARSQFFSRLRARSHGLRSIVFAALIKEDDLRRIDKFISKQLRDENAVCILPGWRRNPHPHLQNLLPDFLQILLNAHMQAQLIANFYKAAADFLISGLIIMPILRRTLQQIEKICHFLIIGRAFPARKGTI